MKSEYQTPHPDPHDTAPHNLVPYYIFNKSGFVFGHCFGVHTVFPGFAIISMIAFLNCHLMSFAY